MKTTPIFLFARRLASLIVFLTPTLGLLYLSNRVLRQYLSLPTIMSVDAWLQSLFIVAFLLFIPALLVSDIRMIYKIVVLILVVPLLCIGSLGLRTEKVLNSVQVDNNRYHLVYFRPWGDNYGNCFLYQCNKNDLECEQIHSYTGICWSVENSQLDVNPTTHEINVFIKEKWAEGRRLVFTYGNQHRSYEDELKLPDFDYYLVYLHKEATYILYQCEKDSMNCSSLPFHYDDADESSYARLEMDEKSGEIKFIIVGQLIYTYGKSPKCYVENCFLTGK